VTAAGLVGDVLVGQLNASTPRRSYATAVGISHGRWNFEDGELAEIFEHYVRRHVPFYDEIHRMVSEISDRFIRDGSRVYDLGTSTGECVLRIHERHKAKRLRFVAVDSSSEMIAKAEVRLSNVPDVEFVLADLNKPFMFNGPDMVTAILLFQFLRPSSRGKLLEEIYHGLNYGGALVIAEKIKARTGHFESMWTEFHNDLKRRMGVDESEIAAKASSLKGVLIPNSLATNMRLIRQAGFREVEVFFKWYNWVGIVAVKAGSTGRT
jgi:tRNA (cmo5U34)-methyltransferase